MGIFSVFGTYDPVAIGQNMKFGEILLKTNTTSGQTKTLSVTPKFILLKGVKIGTTGYDLSVSNAAEDVKDSFVYIDCASGNYVVLHGKFFSYTSSSVGYTELNSTGQVSINTYYGIANCRYDSTSLAYAYFSINNASYTEYYCKSGGSTSSILLQYFY